MLDESGLRTYRENQRGRARVPKRPKKISVKQASFNNFYLDDYLKDFDYSRDNWREELAKSVSQYLENYADFVFAEAENTLLEARKKLTSEGHPQYAVSICNILTSEIRKPENRDKVKEQLRQNLNEEYFLQELPEYADTIEKLKLEYDEAVALKGDRTIADFTEYFVELADGGEDARSEYIRCFNAKRILESYSSAEEYVRLKWNNLVRKGVPSIQHEIVFDGDGYEERNEDSELLFSFFSGYIFVKSEPTTSIDYTIHYPGETQFDEPDHLR